MQGCGAGAQPILDGWIWSQNFLEGGTGAWNFGSSSSCIDCEASEFYKYYSGAGAKNFYMLDSEPKKLNAWSWSLKFEFRSLKFEFD